MAETEALDMDETLEKIAFYCLEQMRGKLEGGEEPVPFTVVVEGDQLFEETYPEGEGADQRANAVANIKSASTFTTHYAWCYDGFLDTDQGQVDSIIVECAQRDMDKAYVIGLFYKEEDGALHFGDQPAFIDTTESYYDRAAVEAAEKNEQENPAAEAAEMNEMQEMLRRNLAPKDDE